MWLRGGRELAAPSSFMGWRALSLSGGDRRCRGFLRTSCMVGVGGNHKVQSLEIHLPAEARIRGGQMKNEPTRELRLQVGSRMVHLEEPRPHALVVGFWRHENQVG